MTTNDEKMRILNMVQEGKLSAQEAVQLLEALDFNPDEKAISSEVIQDLSISNGKARWLKIVVTDLNTGKRKVNLKLPMAIVRWGMKLGGIVNFGNSELDNLDFQNILNEDLFNEGQKGVLVDVEDEDDGEHVVISLE